MSWHRYILIVLTVLLTSAVCLNAAVESVRPAPWLLNLYLRKAGFFTHMGRLQHGWSRLQLVILLDGPAIEVPKEVKKTMPHFVGGGGRFRTGLNYANIIQAWSPDWPSRLAWVPLLHFKKRPPLLVGGGRFTTKLDYSKAIPHYWSPDWAIRIAVISVPLPPSTDTVGGGATAYLMRIPKVANPMPHRLVAALSAIDAFIDAEVGIYFGWNTYGAFHPIAEEPLRQIASVPDANPTEALVDLFSKLCQNNDFNECVNLARFELGAGKNERALQLTTQACDAGVTTGCEVKALALAKMGRFDEAKEVVAPLCVGRTPCRALASVTPPPPAARKK